MSEDSGTQLLERLPGRAPTELGPYQLLEPLGDDPDRFLAQRPGDAAPVALTRIPPGRVPGPAAVPRVLAAATAAAAVRHPYLAACLDAGQQGDDCYVTHEMTGGIDLAAWVRERGPLPWSLACDLARQTALALAAAHAAGVPHGRVGPAVLIATPARPDGGPAPHATVKLVGLGLAPLAAGPADAAADLRALGYTLRVLLTGRAVSPDEPAGACPAGLPLDLWNVAADLLAGTVPHAAEAAERLTRLALADAAPLGAFAPPPLAESVSIVGMASTNPNGSSLTLGAFAPPPLAEAISSAAMPALGPEAAPPLAEAASFAAGVPPVSAADATLPVLPIAAPEANPFAPPPADAWPPAEAAHAEAEVGHAAFDPSPSLSGVTAAVSARRPEPKSSGTGLVVLGVLLHGTALALLLAWLLGAFSMLKPADPTATKKAKPSGRPKQQNIKDIDFDGPRP
jgi:hypothetical protein